MHVELHLLREKCRHHRYAARREKYGGAVQRRLYCQLAGNEAAGAGPIVDDEILPHAFLELDGEQPRLYIGAAVRWKGRQNVCILIRPLHKTFSYIFLV